MLRAAVMKLVVRFTLRLFYPRPRKMSYLCPFGRRVSGSQVESRHSGDEKIPCYCQELNPGRVVRSLSLH
jgi:hypothetical protein